MSYIFIPLMFILSTSSSTLAPCVHFDVNFSVISRGSDLSVEESQRCDYSTLTHFPTGYQWLLLHDLCFCLLQRTGKGGCGRADSWRDMEHYVMFRTLECLVLNLLALVSNPNPRAKIFYNKEIFIKVSSG